MHSFLCPFCNEGEHTNTRPIGAQPIQTDSAWQESEKKHTCPYCKAMFDIKVRLNIETNQILFITQTPKPKSKLTVWYVMAAVNEFGVKVSAVCRDEVLARIIGLSHQRKHSEPLHILKLTSEGYFDEEGKQIVEETDYKDKIVYLEIL